MLGGGLVFLYGAVPLIAAFRLRDRLPDVFARARMRMSTRTLKALCILGLLILPGQGALPFSDIDRVGWAMVAICMLFVAAYLRFRRIDPA